MKGFNCLLYVNETPVAAQMDANLDRSASTSDITNRIELKWEESLIHLRGWRVNCNGAYVVNDDGFKALEEAYVEGEPISVFLKAPGLSYTGQGLIVSFPIGAAFNKDISYNIQILGTGALTKA